LCLIKTLYTQLSEYGPSDCKYEFKICKFYHVRKIKNFSVFLRGRVRGSVHPGHEELGIQQHREWHLVLPNIPLHNSTWNRSTISDSRKVSLVSWSSTLERRFFIQSVKSVHIVSPLPMTTPHVHDPCRID